MNGKGTEYKTGGGNTVADLLYYIMDYRGHYYRSDMTNELVVAADENDASMFTFAQTNNKIGTGKKSSFYCIVPTENNKKISESEEVCNKCISNKEIPVVLNNQIQRKCSSPVKEIVRNELKNSVEKSISSDDLSEIDWLKYLEHFINVSSEVKTYRDKLTNNLTDIDQKICDILHYIELCETKSGEAEDLVELLRICRENRRDIKDELLRTEYFQTNFGTSINISKAKQAAKSIKGLETRKYAPRKYNLLFKDCVMKSSPPVKEALHNAEDNKIHVITEQKNIYRGGKDIMTEDKCVTTLDGKENNWLSFAKQKAEFYRNAEQYMINLNIEINEIDKVIENTLAEAEDVNCNAAQGYNIFKTLKELRIKRKNKLHELNCIYAMTDGVDCSAFAEIFEKSLDELESILNIGNNIELIKTEAI